MERISLAAALKEINGTDYKNDYNKVDIEFTALGNGEHVRFPNCKRTGSRHNGKKHNTITFINKDSGQTRSVKIRLIEKVNGKQVFY